MNLLFSCSRNQWRSPTAEAIFRRRPNLQVRSAGTSPKARRTVNAADVMWADLILVMEPKHRAQLRARFGHELGGGDVRVFNIPDQYRYMDPELVELLEQSAEGILEAQIAPDGPRE